MTSTDSFYNMFYTKLNSQSKRIAANGESKKAYDAIIQIYFKVVELCDYHSDAIAIKGTMKELEMAIKRKEELFPE